MEKFEGGPIFQNSGGTGPDDYLLRKIGTSRWYEVQCRWGRHFTWKYGEDRTGLQRARDNADSDKAALDRVMRQTRRICVGDNATRYYRLREKGKAPEILSFAEFAERFEV